jgi:hypothetical protein
VEAALGLLLITSVLLFGIHFSEVAILSLKVQEAAAAAIWDTTALKMSDLTGVNPDFSPRDGTAIPQAQIDTGARYVDFDGRQAAAGAAPALVFTQAGPITVTCRQENGIGRMNLPPSLASFDPGQGGMACSAQSTFSLAPGFAQTFLGGGALFQEQHAQRATYPICSMGRAQGGNCPAETFVMLGDWGLSDGPEASECEHSTPGTPCANSGYYLMARQIWLDNGGPGDNTGERLARFVLDTTYDVYFPAYVNEAAFLMVFEGEDPPDRYQADNPFGEHRGFGPYTVTPGGPYGAPLQVYEDAASGGGNSRDPCVFGLPCNGRQWPQYP